MKIRCGQRTKKRGEKKSTERPSMHTMEQSTKRTLAEREGKKGKEERGKKERKKRGKKTRNRSRAMEGYQLLNRGTRGGGTRFNVEAESELVSGRYISSKLLA
jgi:hypothetical protein